MKVRIAAMVLDTERLTLYKADDGEEIVLNQGDPRIRQILKQHEPTIMAGQIAEVDLGSVENEAPNNIYGDFEKQTEGRIKFFRVIRRAVQHIFGTTEDVSLQPRNIGHRPNLDHSTHYTGQSFAVAGEEPLVLDTPVSANDESEVPENKMGTTIDEIMARATPISSPEFASRPTESHETIFAVVDNKIIPKVENLESQFAHANKLGSPQGVEKFLKRIAAVIDKRGHSVEDLLRFMEKGDLPIADDGSIVAYKILRSSNEKEVFVDCHTGNVKQRVGSFVCMDPSLVDPNRSQECSNGLHIARRGYLSSFSGDIMVLCKIAPEDVIAVPNYDSNKVRVCGYHILFHVPKGQHAILRKDKPMTGSVEAQRILGMAIKGEHIERIEEVRITQQNGNGVIVTPLVDKPVSAPKPTTEAPKAVAIEPVKPAETKPVKQVAPVDPKKVAAKVVQTKEKLAVVSSFRQLFNDKKFDELIVKRKTSKKSWKALGFSEAEVAQIEAPATKPAPKDEPKKAQPKPAKLTRSDSALTPEGKVRHEKKAPVSPKVTAPVHLVAPENETRQQKVARLAVSLWGKNTTNAKQAAQELANLKKASKKGYDKLGLSNKDVVEIERLLKK